MANHSDEQEILSGSVSSVTFQNPQNGYAVLRLLCDDGELVTVVGTIPMPAAGERLIVTGRWGHHAAYGSQFQAEFLERLLPETTRDILAFLATRVIRGVGERTAERIVERFGTDSLRVIEQEPERLTAIPGISLRKANEMSQSFRSQMGLRRLIEFLASYRLPPELGVRLYRQFGDEAVDRLEENPYLLAEPEFGAQFSAVDAFAIELGCEEDDPRRMDAALQYELLHNLGNGHVFLPEDKLTAATATLLGVATELLAPSCARLVEAGNEQVFFKVIFPLLTPVITTVTILNGMWIWNDYLLPSMMLGQNGAVKTLPVAVQAFVGSYVKQWNLILTAALLAIIPMVVLFLFAQKQIMNGMIEGAVKG